MASAVERLVAAFQLKPVNQLVPIDQLTSLPDNVFYQLFEKLLVGALSVEPERREGKVAELIDHFTLEIEAGLNENYPVGVMARYLVYQGSRLSEEMLQHLTTVFQCGYVKYLDVLLQLANWVSGPTVLPALQALDAIRRRHDTSMLTSEEARLVLSVGQSYNHYLFLNAFSDLFRDLIPTSAVPSYVQDLGLLNLDLDEHVKQLTDEDATIVATAAEQFLQSDETADARQLAQLVLLQDDPVLTRVLGPVNYNDRAPGEQCQKYGGCRYLTCCCHEMEVYDDQGLPDWFLGYCVECGLTIPCRQAAIRQTMPHGGFRGCYCCVRCLATNLYNMEHQDSFVHEDLLSVDVEEYSREKVLANLHRSVQQLLADYLPTSPTESNKLPVDDLYYLSRLPLTDQLLTAATLQTLYRYGLQKGRLDGAAVDATIETSNELYQSPSYYRQLFE